MNTNRASSFAFIVNASSDDDEDNDATWCIGRQYASDATPFRNDLVKRATTEEKRRQQLLGTNLMKNTSLVFWYGPHEKNMKTKTKASNLSFL